MLHSFVGWLLLSLAALCVGVAIHPDRELRAKLPRGLGRRSGNRARDAWPSPFQWDPLESFEAVVHSVIPYRWHRSAYGDSAPAALARVLWACIAACGLTVWGIVALAAGLG
jgi:hypothetical protein